MTELSQFLFSPVTLLLYTGSMLAYFYAMAFSGVDREVGEAAVKGVRARQVGTGLAVLGVAAHLAHVVVRALAAGRLPLGNMFEFSTIIAITVVVSGLLFVQRRMQRPELMGFLLFAALVTLGTSILLYSDPAPLAPILDSWWRAIHVSTIAFAFGIFTLAAVVVALQLLRDTAESRVARLRSGFGADTLGAARAGSSVADDPDLQPFDTVTDRAVLETPSALTDQQADHDQQLALADQDAYDRAMRAVLTQRLLGIAGPWRLVLATFAVVTTFSLVFQRPSAVIGAAVLSIVGALVAWWTVPYLPSAATLDSLAYRTTAFAFPIWTFAVITGAIWAEQSWGRYWGWDPKETSAFLTWVAYAGYLHARATKGIRGRGAAWLGLGAYGVLLFTYYVVNLLISGLHSYGGLPSG